MAAEGERFWETADVRRTSHLQRTCTPVQTSAVCCHAAISADPAGASRAAAYARMQCGRVRMLCMLGPAGLWPLVCNPATPMQACLSA